MKMAVSFYDFEQAFQIRKENFTYSGLRALFEYLEDLEENIGEEIELDVIALCCDYTEYDSALEAAQNCCDFEVDEDQDSEDQEQSALEFLQDNTQVIEVCGGGVIIQNF
jgi:hypothetical protein